MTLSKTFPTDRSGGLPVADTRLVVGGMVESDTTGKPRAGVLPSGYGAVVTGTSGMSYNVAAFNAVTVRSGNAAEFVSNDAVVSVATTAAPGANSRIDVIWVRSLFTTYADGSSDPVIGVTQGTASASPTKPSIPAGALELATAVILSTTTQTSTAVITQTHPYTAMEGGVVALRSQTEQDAWTPPDGSAAYRIDTQSVLTRRDGAWVVGAPTIALAAGAARTATGSINVELWSVPSTGESVATPGWFTYDASTGDITCVRAGRYEIEARVAVAASTSSPQPAVAIYIIRNGSSTDILTQEAIETHTAFSKMAKLSIASISLAAGAKLRVWVPTGGVVGSVTLGGAGRANGEFMVRFLG